jgi:site-specific DNA-methyltransferase (adenine-specific)
MNIDSPTRYDLLAPDQRAGLLRECRLGPGEIWRDPLGRHVVGCGDAADPVFVGGLRDQTGPICLAIQDPPYNLVAFERRTVEEYIAWCRRWVDLTCEAMADDGALYVWLGADQTRHFEPLPQFMQMMAQTSFTSRSFITMRNQRGRGTPGNWMAVRQELLYYTKGSPPFEVQYTNIPKAVQGYYKTVDGRRTENLERSKSPTIRAGNVWIDIQQVFYRLEENVSGCYAQKPLAAIERIVRASSREGDTVLDSFAHAGTTLLACERTGRRCVTFDIDPIFAEITIRRLERFRATGKTGWQRDRPLG